MKFKNSLPILTLLLLTVLYLLGTAAVPFHPDEATQIFMSGDLETFLRQPSNLYYSSSPVDALRQEYRLLDAPLTRWLIGIGRSLAGFAALPAGWNWSLTWQENQQAGALPPANLLQVSRLSVAWLFGLSLLFAYRSGVLLRGKWLGWFNVVLAVTNALVLLHTRRAMAESALFFTVSWLVYVLAKKETNPLLLALPVALALNAKQTTIGLVVVGLLALWFFARDKSWRLRLRNALLYAVLILLVTYLLNPVAWKNPIQTARAALEARSRLASEQLATMASVSPELVMQSPAQRLPGWIVYLAFSPPAVADVANYLEDTRTVETDYFASPLNNLLRNKAGGAVLLILCLSGFLLAAYRALRNAAWRVPLILLQLATLGIFLTLVIFIPLPFQRYTIAMIPFTNLWAAYLLSDLVMNFIARSRIK